MSQPLLALSTGELQWSYPNSVDRYQGFTVVSVRVAMNCCSYSIGLR